MVKTSEGGYNEKVDIWALGITIIELVEGSPPLAEYPPLTVLLAISKCEPPQLKEPESVGDEIKDFLAKCFTIDPGKRPSAQQLLEVLTTTAAEQTS